MYIKLVGVYISDIHLQVLYTPTSFLQEVYMKFIHLLLSNLIGQNVQAMVQMVIPASVVTCTQCSTVYTYALRLVSKATPFLRLKGVACETKRVTYVGTCDSTAIM